MFKIKKLDNGVRIVTEEIPSFRSISLGFWVENGSRHETEENNGMSHFIEHMLFKGTQKRTSKQIAEEMDSIGGQMNAYTAKEYTCYHSRTLDNHFDSSLDILADMLFNSKFDEEDINKEKGIVIEEINMYEDSPEELVHDILQEEIWKGDALGYTITGTSDNVSKFNSQRIKDYYEKHYYPENTVISVAGNLKHDEICEKIEKYFVDWKSQPKTDILIKPNTIYTPSIKTKVKDIEQVHVCLGLEGLKSNSTNKYPLAIINSIFGGGMSSRLFQKIREDRGLAYSVYSYHSSYKTTGLLGIYAAMNPSQTQEVIKLVLDEIQELKEKKLLEEEVAKTKEQIKSNYIIGLESTGNRMSHLGMSLITTDKIQTPDEIIQKLDEVTMEKINEVIDEIFDISKLSLSAVGKVKKINFEKLIGR